LEKGGEEQKAEAYSTNSEETLNQIMLHEKKVFKLDPNRDSG
jgi:hypothetical protein